MSQPLAIEVLTHTTARGLHRLVEVGMASYGSEENLEVFPMIETLAERVGMGQTSVRAHLADLLKAGEIERVGKRGRAIVYRITCRWRSMPEYSTLPAAVSRRRVSARKRRIARSSDTRESAVSRGRDVVAQRRIPASRSATQRRITTPSDPKSTPQYDTLDTAIRSGSTPYRDAPIKNRQRDPSGSLTPPAPPYTEMSESTTTAGEYRPDGLVELKLDQSLEGLSATEPGAVNGVTANGVPAAEKRRHEELVLQALVELGRLADTDRLRPCLEELGWIEAMHGAVGDWLRTLSPAELSNVITAAQRHQEAT